MLVEELGLDPGPALRRLETDILNHADRLGVAGEVWARAAADYDRTVAAGARARLESTVGLLRDLAVTGGLEAARGHRAAAVAAAEQLGDPELTARVIGAYDVPAIWTRVDDPEQAAGIVAAAERTLTALGPDAHDAARARLLATIALESRGTHARRGPQAAREAEAIARRLDDPTLLAFALNAAFMQRFERTGLAAERDAIGRRADRPLGAARPRELRGPGPPDPPAGELRAGRPERRRRPRGGGRRAGGAPRAPARGGADRPLPGDARRHRGGVPRSDRPAGRCRHARPAARDFSALRY